MGISLKDMMEENPESLVEDKSKKTMKLMLFVIGLILFIIVIVVVMIIKNHIDGIERDYIKAISTDMAHLRTKVELVGSDYRSGKAGVELIGRSLEVLGRDEEPMSKIINGKREEYRYGYYYLTAEEANMLDPDLNIKDQAYIVNYTNLDVISDKGVKHGGVVYYSLADITAIANKTKLTTYEIINKPEDMLLLYKNPNGYYKLSSDIDMSMFSAGNGWEPVENFSGVFEGRGYKISNLTISRPSQRYCGLFGQVTASATLSEVRLENVRVEGGEFTGALAGSCSGNIINCSVDGEVSSQQASIGGLVGSYDTGVISNSSSEAVVSGQKDVGGLVGTFYGGTIKESYATNKDVEITGAENVGGLIGSIRSTGTGTTTLSETYSECSVVGTENVGGLIGNLECLKAANIQIKYSYSDGAIKAADRNAGGSIGNLHAASSASISFDEVYTASDTPSNANVRGGFIGKLNINSSVSLNVSKCFWEKDSYIDKDVPDIGSSTTTVTFESRRPDEMRSVSTFGFWDLTNIWNVDEGSTRPYFKWQSAKK